MVDPILFQAFPLDDWPWGGDSGTLYIFNDGQWTDQNGVVRLKNTYHNLDEPRQRCPITVVDRAPVVQDFFYQPTTLSIDRPDTRRTGVVYDVDDNEHYTLFKGAVFPAVPDPMSWPEFVRYNFRARCAARKHDRYLDADAIYALVNNLETISAQDLTKLATARGVAQMAVDVGAAASQVVVPCVLVTANSIIKAYSQDAGVSGSLNVPERTEGQDFTVRSSVIGDEGLIGWEVSEPF